MSDQCAPSLSTSLSLSLSADFNGDGYLDIYEACSTDHSSSNSNLDTFNRLYLSDGQGGFTLSSDPAAKGEQYVESKGVVAGDFNGDGAIDLFVANKWAHLDNALLLNDGSGSFTLTEGADAVGAPSYSRGATSCDLDGDGDLGKRSHLSLCAILS